MWESAADYSDIVAQYQVMKKLKRVKAGLKLLNKKGFSNVQIDDHAALQRVNEIQKALLDDPRNKDLIDAEVNALKDYKVKHKVYVEFLQQKAKLNWLKDGDANTALFHSSLKMRRLQNSIFTTRDLHGNWVDTPEGISNAFLDYYLSLLGTKRDHRAAIMQDVVDSGPKVTMEQCALLRIPLHMRRLRRLCLP